MCWQECCNLLHRCDGRSHLSRHRFYGAVGMEVQQVYVPAASFCRSIGDRKARATGFEVVSNCSSNDTSEGMLTIASD